MGLLTKGSSRFHGDNVLPKQVSVMDLEILIMISFPYPNCGIKPSTANRRYWSLALPIWLFVLVIYLYVAFFAINLYNTEPLDSFLTITGKSMSITAVTSILYGLVKEGRGGESF